MVLPFPLPFPFPLPQWQMPPVAAFVFLDFAFPFAFFSPFAFAFAEEVFIEIRRRTPLRTDAFLSACGGADDPIIAEAISRCSATSAVAIIAMLRLRHFFGGTIGEEGSRSSILLNIRGSPSSSSSMSSVGWSDRSTVSGKSLPGSNASVEGPGNDGNHGEFLLVLLAVPPSVWFLSSPNAVRCLDQHCMRREIMHNGRVRRFP